MAMAMHLKKGIYKMSLFNQLKNNIIQDQKVANFVMGEVSGYMDNLADDGLIYSPNYEDWNILLNDLKTVNVFPHTMPYPPSLYQDILIENLEGELESESYSQTLEDCGINLADYEEPKMYKTMVNFRFWCTHEKEVEVFTAEQLKYACMSTMKKLNDTDIIGSTEIEYDTTEEAE